MLERYNRVVGDVNRVVELCYEDRGILNAILCLSKWKSALNPIGIRLFRYL